MANNDDYKRISADLRKILSSRTFPSNAELYNEIIELEDIWRQIILSTAKGYKVYEQFITYILEERKNILDVRPYFRLRQKHFLTKVNPLIRKKNAKALSKLRANFTFVAWANARYNGANKKQLVEIEQRIATLRGDFLTKNFPLVLNRLKILINQYPGLDNIPDLITAASQASLNAIDKFEPTLNPDTGEVGYSSVLLSTIIGRIRAMALSAYSNQVVHLYPKDKKKLIEINRLKKDGKSDQDISIQLNVSEGELHRLYQSFFPSFIDDHFHQLEDSSEISDEILVNKENSAKLRLAINSLSILEQKVLSLKGYNF